MDFNLNEYPTGGFFGGGYDGSVLADGLDTGKKQSTGSPLGIYTKFESNGSTSDFCENSTVQVIRGISLKMIKIIIFGQSKTVYLCAFYHFLGGSKVSLKI